MSSWFRDPKQLVDNKKIFEFWPTIYNHQHNA